MAVYVKKSYGNVNDEAHRQQFSDPVEKMNDILADNVIDKQQALLWINVSCLTSLYQTPINMLVSLTPA